MSIGLVFWIIMLIWLIHWAGANWGGWPGPAWASGLILFILFFLLGWHDFGFMIHQ